MLLCHIPMVLRNLDNKLGVKMVHRPEGNKLQIIRTLPYVGPKGGPAPAQRQHDLNLIMDSFPGNKRAVYIR